MDIYFKATEERLRSIAVWITSFKLTVGILKCVLGEVTGVDSEGYPITTSISTSDPVLIIVWKVLFNPYKYFNFKEVDLSTGTQYCFTIEKASVREWLTYKWRALKTRTSRKFLNLMR